MIYTYDIHVNIWVIHSLNVIIRLLSSSEPIIDE